LCLREIKRDTGSTADTLPPVMVQEAENDKDKNDNCRGHGDRCGGNRPSKHD